MKISEALQQYCLIVVPWLMLTVLNDFRRRQS